VARWREEVSSETAFVGAFVSTDAAAAAVALRCSLLKGAHSA